MTRTQVITSNITHNNHLTDQFMFGFVTAYDGTQQTTIAFDGINTFTLAPTGTIWSYYRNGVKCTITESKTATLSGSPPAAKGTYFIYIDSTDGTLIVSTSSWTLADTKVPVASISWDNTLTPKYWMMNERHTCAIDRRFHWEHHFTDGTEVRTMTALNGYSVTPPSPNTTDNTFSMSQAIVVDEDLSHTAAAVSDPNGVTTPYVIWYRTAAAVWSWAYSEVPYRYTASGYIQYDNAGTMTEGGSGNYYNTYLLITCIEGNASFSFIHGQTQYTTLALAQAENFSSLTKTGLGIDEYIAAYQITWQTSAAYTSLGKCRLAAAPKAISVSASGVTTGGSIEHNTLTGIQGGTIGEFYHLQSSEYTAISGVITTVSGLPTTYLKLNASNDPITGSLLIQPATDTQNLILKHSSAGATANIQEWQDSSSNILAFISGTGQLDVTSPTFPVIRATRTTSLTNSYVSAAVFKATSSGDMADGFGTNFSFQIRDTAGVDNNVAAVGVIRDGADNSGKIFFDTYNAGINLIKMVVDKTGYVGIGIAAPTAKLHVVGSTDTQQLLIKGNATQVNNLTEWQTSGGTVLASISGVGIITAPNIRDTLTAARTYYVRTDGSDANTGLVNSAAGAFLTIQKAIDTVAVLDIRTYAVSIQLGDGTYDGGIIVSGPWVGSGEVFLQGNSTTPNNTVVTYSSGITLQVTNGARLTLRYIRLENNTNQSTLSTASGGNVRLASQVHFGKSGFACIDSRGGSVYCNYGGVNVYFEGNALYAIYTSNGFISLRSGNMHINNAPTYTYQFAAADLTGVIFADGITFNYPAITLSAANPCVLSYTAHGMPANQPFYLTTTGALPAPLVANTTYYVKTVTNANSFTLSTSAGGAEISTLGGTQSGVHSIKSVTTRYLSSSNSVIFGGGGAAYFPGNTGGSTAGGIYDSQSTPREFLTADKTYYVRTDGSNSNTGLANTSGGAFLTIQYAINIASSLDLGNYNVTINVADGTYAEALVLKTFAGAGIISITGNTTTPANVILNTGNGFNANGVKGTYTLRGFTTSGNGYGIAASNGSIVNFGNFVFSNAAASHIFCQSNAVVTATQNYSISGNFTTHLQPTRNGYINVSGRTVTLIGTPAYSIRFVYADLMGLVEIYNMTFIGSATGTRYYATDNSVIFTNAGGATYLPGNAGGSTANGGQYL